MFKRFEQEGLRRIRGHDKAHVVLLWLTASVRSQNQVQITRKELGERCGCSQPTLRKALQVLREASLIRFNKENRIIEINPRLYWQGYDEVERQREIGEWRPEFVRKPELRAVP